jgi:LytS/YehU family sensor histidine kinase
MNILKKQANLLNIIQRILDVCILLVITWLFGKKYGPPELIRVYALYGSLFLIVIFSLFNIYKSWRDVPIANQILTLFLA